MSLTFTVPSYQFVSTDANVERTDQTQVGDKQVCVWHYKNTNQDLPSEVMAVRGVVSVDENTRGFFPMTKELTVFEDGEEKRNVVQAIDGLLENTTPADVTVYEAYEAACLLRVFNVDGTWFVSSNHKLDSSKSQWNAPRNFREQFRDALQWVYTHSRSHSEGSCPTGDNAAYAEFWQNAPELATPEAVETYFLESLDSEKGYTFLVSPTVDNRNFLVSPPKATPMLYNVGVFADSGRTLLYNETTPGVPKPARLELNLNTTDLTAHLCELTSSGGISRQGVMVFTPTTHFKLVSHEYHYKSGLRENNTILYQYVVYNMNLQTIPAEDVRAYSRRFDDFLELYRPVWGSEFAKVDDALGDVSWELARAYYRRNRPRQRDDAGEQGPDTRDRRQLCMPEFKVVSSMHQRWIAGIDPESGRKTFRVFRHINPSNGRGRSRHFAQDPEGGEIEYNMDFVWDCIYNQEHRDVYKMAMRRIRYGDQWSVYQKTDSRRRGGNNGNNREPARRSFGRNRRMVSKSGPQTETKTKTA